jgi:hypothetical protein
MMRRRDAEKMKTGLTRFTGLGFNALDPENPVNPVKISAPLRLCGEINRGSWLPDMDLNHDKQIQSLLCYRYTIGQCKAGVKVSRSNVESRN